MMPIDSLILQYVAFQKPLAYGILFLAMFVEGDIFLFTAAFLAAQRFLDGELVFVAIVGGTLSGDALWYFIGHKLNHSENRVNKWIVRATGHLDNHLLNAPLRTIFISKFIYGIHHLILIRVGVIKIRFKEFIKNDILSSLAWFFVVGGLGYISGTSFGLLRQYLRFIEVGLVFAVILFLAGEIVLARYFREKL